MLTLYPEQEEVVQRMLEEPTRAVLNASSLGTGKAQPLSEPVLTPYGWTTMGNIKKGDYVVGADGLPTEVVGVFPQGEKEIVKVTFSDGSWTRATWDHLWTVRGQIKNGKPSWEVLTTRQIVDRGIKNSYGQRAFFIPQARPVQYEGTVDLPLDPYLVGVLLGDGSMSKGTVILSTDAEIVESLVLPEDCSVVIAEAHSDSYNEYRVRGMYKRLRAMDLAGKRSEDKFIPQEYLYASVESRVALLQGLLDTDGSANSNRGGAPGPAVEYGTVSEVLAAQVTELVQSLGGTVRATTRNPWYTYKGERRYGQKFYRLRIKLGAGIVPFRLKRKLAGWTPATKYPPSRALESIEVVGREEAQCIKVAASDSLYLTRDFIVTHNTVCTVELVKRLDAKTVLLIGPLNVDKAWKKTFEGQNVVLPFFHINSTKAGLQAFADLKARVPGIYYIGREFFALSGTDKKRKDGTYARKARWSWASVKPDVACWDEAHSASNRKTASADALRPLKAGYKVALSATPAGNKFQGFWAVTRWLWPEQIPKSFWKWADEWAVVEPDEYTYKKVTGEKNPGAFVKSLPCYVKLEANLQEPLVKRFECPLTPEQRKQFDELKKQAMTWIDNNPLVADLPITLKIRLRQATLAEMNLEVGDDGTERVYFDLDAPSSKIDTIEQIIAANPDENMLILTDSQRFAEVAAHRLGPRAVEWSGKTSQQERQRILTTFGHVDGPKYIVGVIPALAEGVDGLQHHARIVVWCNKSTNNLLNIQASGRLNRTGQKHRVTSVELVAPNTLDTAEIDWLNVTAAEMKASLTNI